MLLSSRFVMKGARMLDPVQLETFLAVAEARPEPGDARQVRQYYCEVEIAHFRNRESSSIALICYDLGFGTSWPVTESIEVAPLLWFGYTPQ